MQENDLEAEDAAIWFLQENVELWRPWVTEDAYQNILTAIE